MKVKCFKLLDDETGETAKSDAWLSIGAEYVVLSVYTELGGKLKFQLLCEDGGTPAFHLADQFEVISNKVPSCWQAGFVSGSHFELTPKAWAAPGFWEKYFDGDIDTITIFESERAKMIREET